MDVFGLGNVAYRKRTWDFQSQEEKKDVIASE